MIHAISCDTRLYTWSKSLQGKNGANHGNGRASGPIPFPLSAIPGAFAFLPAPCTIIMIKTKARRLMMDSVKLVLEYLRECEVFYMATVDGLEPRVRGYGD